MKNILIPMIASLIMTGIISSDGAFVLDNSIETNVYDSITELTIVGNCYETSTVEGISFREDGYFWNDELRGWDEQFGNMTDELSKCTKLEELSIYFNSELDSIDFVANMPELRSLVIYMGSFSDLTPLANCTKLEKLVIYGVEELTDISPLANLTNLKYLEVSGASIDKIWAVAAMHELEELYIRYNRCEIVDQDIAFTCCGKLRWLALICPNIDISAMSMQQNNLEALTVGGGKLDLSPLKNQKKLEYLCIEEAEIDDVSPLNTCAAETVSLYNCDINDTTEIEKLTVIDIERTVTIGEGLIHYNFPWTLN